MDFIRNLEAQINWKARLICIRGARGTGKTTLMLQHIKKTFKNLEKVIYVSLDNLYFSDHSLLDFVDSFAKHGGRFLFLDEVHKYPSWQIVMKNIYDGYPKLHVAFTGSSMLKIDNSKADLSRRLSDYTLHGLSFREFLSFEAGIDVPAVPLEELLANHVEIARQITSQVKILPLFEKYLEYGYYPFYKEDFDNYHEKLKKTVYTVLNEDVPAIEEITYPSIQKLQRMLMILAERVPQTPKMNELYAILETTREQGLKMLSLLQRAALMLLLSSETKEIQHLSKPDKIYVHNLMYALTDYPDKGTLRETFFINQLSSVAEVSYPRKGDFIVNRKYLFEVGGRNKTFNQIKDIPNSFLAIDGVETGFFNRIPLWLFGMLY